MLRGKINAVEPEGTEALWIRELSRIESSYGRLVYLAGLRNQDTGKYEHYASTAGSPKSLIASRAFKRIHETIFADWVCFTLERKKADIELYIAGLEDVGRAELIDAWLRLRPYLNLVPAAIQGPERQRHVSDFEAILGLLKNVYGVSSPDPSA